MPGQFKSTLLSWFHLVKNAYVLLGKDWLETANLWEARGFPTPPVMITVANRIETATRIKYAFDGNRFQIEELSDPVNVIKVDSKSLDKADKITIDDQQFEEIEDESEKQEDEQVKAKLTKKQEIARVREVIATVGKVGKTGEKIKSVISVNMLSEGWDAKTVTHIMGLRAFNSQLLCEQVVGRGLRRTSYDPNEEGMFEPEYVNIFGVPFTYMPHEDTGIVQPRPPTPKFAVEPIHERKQFEISWPNVLRVEPIFKPQLTLDVSRVPLLTLDAYETATLAELAPVVDGKPDITRLSEIDLTELGRKYRTQKIVFETARDVYEQIETDWKNKGNKEYLLAQVIRIVENFIRSDRIVINPPLFNQGDLRKRIIITLNMSKVVQHIWEAIRINNTESLELVIDTDQPIRSTGDMTPWHTSRPWEYTRKSHINRCVFDSNWEASEAYELDRNQNVAAWAKNDHLGFGVYYTYQGATHTYWPDYLIRLTNGEMLVLEVKGKDDQQNQTKREFLDEWIRAVNAHGGFGKWRWEVSRNPSDLKDILAVQDPMEVVVAENNPDIVTFIELKLGLDIKQLTLEMLNAFKIDLAKFMRVEPQDIHFIGFRPGSAYMLGGVNGKYPTITDNFQEELHTYALEGIKQWPDVSERLTFISCNDDDLPIGVEILNHLTLEDFNPWLRQESIEIAENIPFAIQKALHDSTGFVFCFSATSNTPIRFHEWEVEEALRKASNEYEGQIYFFPVQVRPCEIPKEILDYRWLSWSEENSKQKLVKALHKGLERRKQMAQSRGKISNEDASSSYEQLVFISYAWGDEREEIVNQIDQALQNRGLKIVRDKRDLEYRGSIKEFMERIGRGDCVIVVISDKYLRSPNCMFELVEIAENKDFQNRIFPIIWYDANIYDPLKRIDYIKYWETKRTELAKAIKKLDPANLQGIREEMDLYDRIRDKVSGLTSILKDMNVLTPEMHKESNFSQLYDAIEKRMNHG